VQLVLDWDGTVTERDTLDLVLQEFGDREIYERLENDLDAGRLTHNEVVTAEFATVTAPLEQAVAHVVEHARIRPGFAELARERHPLIVSSGFHELIEPVLDREGVLGEVELRANRVEARADGWRVLFRVSDTCAECGEPCKRADLPSGEVVYAGDSHSDFCASLAADRVFATDRLARYLAERGVSFTPLTDFRALASAL
jgi:2-hydroxy-3-keto-5-methylthiopentenyl-1-phosphate phosphatase